MAPFVGMEVGSWMTSFGRHLANAFPPSKGKLDRSASVRAELAAMEQELRGVCTQGDRTCAAKAQAHYRILAGLGAWDKADAVAKRWGVAGRRGLDFSRIFTKR